ncbi:MAG: carbohydrate ABC transporter permease [Clostridia bacterium]|nr:carbohydrate ABC transporter permease [Clostridia bacterium]
MNVHTAHRRRRIGKRQIAMLFKYALIAVLCVIFLSPFVVMITTSFKSNSDAFTLPVKILPRTVVLTNFSEATSKIPYFLYYRNTIFITVLSVLGQVLVTPMIAYSLSKIRWKGAPFISGLLMATMMIPHAVTMIPVYKIWSTLRLTNTYAPLILPCFFGSSFNIIIVRQFFNGLPNSLFEAAKIDGANELQRYYMIALPLSKPALTTIGIYAFLNAWSDYMNPLIYINKQEKYTLSLGLQSYMSQFAINWPHLMAAATLFVIPVVIFFAIFQRNFVEGVATTGMKA